MKDYRIFRLFLLMALLIAVSIKITSQVDDYYSLPSGLSHSKYYDSSDTLIIETI